MNIFRYTHARRLIAMVFSLVVLIGLMLFAASAANAGYKSTENVYAWDYSASKYQNSNVVIPFNGTWVPFFHEMNTFDAAVYPTDYILPPGAPTDACPGMPGSTTTYAGILEFGLYHTDNAPAGAPGFVRSYDWTIVRCDRTGDGSFNNADLSLAPGTANMVVDPTAFIDVFSIDQVRPCSGGNCQDEIVTSMYVNFDLNCDGVLDPPPPGGRCFYALAQTPTTLTWSGPLQARISAGGGDKTLNFNPSYPAPPLDVTVSSITGSSPAVRYGAGLLLLAVVAAILVVWRVKRKE